MFIALGQRVLMEKLLQTMSSPQGNRAADTKQHYCFLLSLASLFFFRQTKHKHRKGHSRLEGLLASLACVIYLAVVIG